MIALIDKVIRWDQRCGRGSRKARVQIVLTANNSSNEILIFNPSLIKPRPRLYRAYTIMTC